MWGVGRQEYELSVMVEHCFEFIILLNMILINIGSMAWQIICQSQVYLCVLCLGLMSLFANISMINYAGKWCKLIINPVASFISLCSYLSKLSAGKGPVSGRGWQDFADNRACFIVSAKICVELIASNQNVVYRMCSELGTCIGLIVVGVRERNV